MMFVLKERLQLILMKRQPKAMESEIILMARKGEVDEALILLMEANAQQVSYYQIIRIFSIVGSKS